MSLCYENGFIEKWNKNIYIIQVVLKDEYIAFNI